ncbi:dual specificity protein phosphatase MPK-4-like [Pectinophora gossypiella]|nr:dual specificity protein phosphatase MPK-4-like [Pectinophora gossypiella]XP_049887985.1 dual specificity protein phosphatase MPK-4-like [Pectinophora gossypiella]XP_049887986.1 dual specificity protein phosphatase MPK-4-like [Pectinophora gossypiella]
MATKIDAEVEMCDQEYALEEVSVDKIDDGLYLGNLATARNYNTMRRLGITHILTIDLVPLPQVIQRHTPKFTCKYIKLADIPKEDLISILPVTNEFIKEAVASGGTILVHCYFGVSRSGAVVVGYIMSKYKLCYDDALYVVRSKRRYVHPNMGFVAQLKLWGHMGCRIDKDDPRYKQFRLKMAGQRLKTVKILPQLFADLVKPDPGLTRERPDPIVYRCKKCRRVVAGHDNIIPHVPRPLRIQKTKKNMRPPPSTVSELQYVETGHVLYEKLRELAQDYLTTNQRSSADSDSESLGRVGDRVTGEDSGEGSSQELLDGYSEHNLVDGHIAGRDEPEVCRQMWFVEPMSWMEGVSHEPQGKLHCPKCKTKIGSFSWVMACKCPCGQKVAPAFYLVPSKVEWSNIVQNVQVTI